MESAGVLDKPVLEVATRNVAAPRPGDLAGIYDAYSSSLYRYLLAMLGAAEDAEDAMQELFCALARTKLERIQDLRAYLFQAARRQAISVLRSRRRHDQEQVLDEISWVEATACQDDDIALAVDLNRALVRLPAEQRELITLHLREGFSFREIAEVCRISPHTAASRYRLALAKLRVMLQEGE